MHSSVVLLVLSFIAAALAQDCQPCATMKWATCDGAGCPCTLLVGENVKQSVNCSALVPKCFLMKAEMYRAKKGLSTRSISGKPTEHAFVDNDGIYDPECENTGIFKAKQCNNTDTCWCVNSAGVRRTDKGDKNLKCEKLVDTYWIRTELKHKDVQADLDANILKSAIADAIQKRYNLDKKLVQKVEYDKNSKTIVVDLQKEKNGKEDLATVAYYMEKDIKILPLFTSESKLTPRIGNQDLDFSNILIYYVDSDPPTFTMKRLTGGVIAVIVVVILAVVAGLVVLYLARRRERANYQKTQVREMDEMQKSLS
ncbi:epithelial cell adhesion molecule [Lepisosteus oculatus]|uniref:epithelial cell adhesion molecule n=1 Tax=Lepisosteus oculatus TaxID=7918 RepID=UPI0035F52781